jgi:hypothetical protein
MTAVQRTELGTIVAVTTCSIDKDVHTALRLASVRDNRLMLAIATEAALEWLVAHGHELPEGYELVDEEAST